MFRTKRYFGHDSIRGEAKSVLTPELALKLGKALGCYITESGKTPKVIIGQDSRMSGNMLSSAIISGLTSFGVECIYLGIANNPTVSFISKIRDVSFGVSVSHFSSNYKINGIKIFNSEGERIDKNIEDALENFMLNDDLLNYKMNQTSDVGRIVIKDLDDEYDNFILDKFKNKVVKVKILVDLANGSLYRIAKNVLSKISEATFLNDSPNGENIQNISDPRYLEQFSKLVVKGNYELGVVFNSEGTAMVLVDQEGNIIYGDKIVALICILTPNLEKIVVSTKVSKAIVNFLRSKEINVIISEENSTLSYGLMSDFGANMVARNLGRILFKDHIPCSDALYTVMEILKLIPARNSRIIDILSEIPEYFKVFMTIDVTKEQREKFFNSLHMKEFLSSFVEKLGPLEDMRFNLSDDEDTIKVAGEASDQKRAYDIAYNATSFIKKELEIE